MTKLARFSFNCRDPIPKNVKSSCSPRHKNRGLEGLTKSNLLTEFDGRNPQTIRFKRDGRGTSPKHESGKPFSDRESFTKSYRLDFHSGKTVDQSIPTGKAEDSRRSASTGREPSRRRGAAIFFSRRESAFSGWQLDTVLHLSIVSILSSCHSSSGVYLGAHLFGD